MDTQPIEELLAIMDKADLTALRYNDGSLSIELERKPSANILPSVPLMAERVRELLNMHEQGHQAAAIDDANDASTLLVRSPMVGTFYTSPSPDEEPFVKIGQEVLSGQTLAIVEAMKMMNEVTTPAPGVIVEILATSGAQVEYDQPLFRISTAIDVQ